jgi:hypothetical protein
MLMVVNSSIAGAVAPQIDLYSATMRSAGSTIFVEEFNGNGSAEELKAFIAQFKNEVDSIFLIGDLPAAWYEQYAFGTDEQFPIDLFFMDFTAQWTDQDGDGVYDDHSELYLTHAVSRLDGNSAEIDAYFSKLLAYHEGAGPELRGAYVFKDNDWFNFYRGNSLGLDSIYRNIYIGQDEETTNKAAYQEYLNSPGAEYVYQWIHAKPSTLYFDAYSTYDTFSYDQIGPMVKGRFVNMFNCKGARFTQTNLGMGYLTETDSALAVTGSTKVGGNHYPLEFHRQLSLGNSWGYSFISWYNQYGKYDDEWFLGMVILGDPSLRIQEMEPASVMDRASLISILPPLKDDSDQMGNSLMEFDLNNPD